VSLEQLQQAKEQVRQAIDIVDLVGGYIGLRRQGRNFVGLCPWHDDSRPSLQVNPERQSWKCWVCDVGGDIFSYVMRAEGLEFREALEMLAERAGVVLEPAQAATSQEENLFSRRNLLRAAAWAEQQFHQFLINGADAQPARRYVADRGINDDSVRRFLLGYAPHQWQWLLSRAADAGVSADVLERIGLVAKRDSGGYYDRFRGRVIFPIRDAQSRPIAFGGRVLPELAAERDAKYINSPETPLFSKSNQLYALDAARNGVAREGCVVVMEGYTDCLMAHQHGIENVVAVLGTALGEKHIPLIRRFTDSIVLVLDGDAAGQSRTLDILDNLLALFVENDVDLRILTLPEGADPCDVIASQGRDAFRQLLAQSVDALEHKINAVTNGLASTSDTHRSTQAVESILSTLARAFPSRDAVASTTLLREQQVLGRVARQFGVTVESLGQRLKDLRSRRRPRLSNVSSAQDDMDDARPSAPSAWQCELLELLLHHPNLIEPVVDEVGEVDFENPAARAIYTAAVDLHHRGIEPTFEKLTLAIDDQDVQSLLVACDERGREKSASDAAQRFHDLIQDLRRRRQETRHQATMADLNLQRLDPEHEMEALHQLYDDLRRKEEAKRR